MPAKTKKAEAPQTDATAAAVTPLKTAKTTKSTKADKPAATPKAAAAAKTVKARKPKAASSASVDLVEEIRTEAYLIWLNEGQPHGRDQEHWVQAETVVRSRTFPLQQAAE